MDRRWIIGLCIAAGLGVAWLFFPKAAPESETYSFAMEAGDVRRRLVSPRTMRRFRRAPQHIDYQSTNGPVEIYLLKFDLDDEAMTEKMLHMSDALSKGTPPADPIAAASGKSHGRIDFPFGGPLPRTHYLVLFKAKQKTDVTLRVSYGKD